MHFSLHRAATPKVCDICGGEIPARKLPAFSEYWRAKGGMHGAARTICCLCHALYDLPTDGWEVHADGIEVMSVAIPEAQ